MSVALDRGPIPIRRATAADVVALAEIEAIAFPHPWSASQLASELRQPAAIGWVVEEAEEVMGYALFRRVLEEAELLRLAVHTRGRRRGLARALADHGLERLRREGCTSVFLEVREDNAGAIAFYACAGWRQAGRRRHYYPDGSDALLFRRAL